MATEDGGRRVALSIRIPLKLKHDIEELASAERRRSLAAMVELLLEDAVAAKKSGGKPAGKRK